MDGSTTAETTARLDLIGLHLRDVSHAYGARKAVDRVTLTVAPGELVCLLGPSGCGKTTLLRLAAGLETLQAGSVALDGRVLATPGREVPPEARGIGLVFQDYALFPHLDVAGNVGFGLAGIAAKDRDARIAETLAQVGMLDYAKAWPHELSGGQQQRVALARALAPRPRVVLMDEPFSGLDSRLRETVRDDTLRVLKEHGAATLMVTHDPEEAMFMADRIAVMREGQIDQFGAPDRVYAEPASAFVARFFGPVNEWAATVDAGGEIATPFGAMGAAGHAKGAAVRVVIRPEALKLAPSVSGAARVVAARPLGRSSWLRIAVGGHEFHARIPGRFLPEAGAAMAVELDPREAFIFVADVPN